VTRPALVARLRRGFLHLVLTTLALAWLAPIAWAAYTSLRPFPETAALGYVSIAQSLTLDNYWRAAETMDLGPTLFKTLLIVVPSVVLTLAIASFAAFAISRFSWRFNLAALLLMTAANLLPQQALIAPLFRLYLALPLPAPLSDNGTFYDQAIGLIAIHVAMQLGFCTFVLSNFMKTLPREMTEAALMDGASMLQHLRRIILPMSRAPLAALATLEVAWLYNDFFWALFLMRTGDKRPITSALNGLQGEFFRDGNLLAAAAIIVAIPPLLVHLALERNLVRGLALNRGER
jgi:multiple sugar transport system permease protein